MNSTTTTTVTDSREANVLADQINAMHAEGVTLLVNDRLVRTYGSRPATVWQNGTLSVDVRTRSGNGITQVWAKVGQVVTVEVAA